MEKNIRNVFEKTGPSESQKEAMWERISRSKGRRRRDVWKGLGMAAAFCAVILLTGMGANAATGGKVMETVVSFWEKTQKEGGVIEETLEIRDHMEVYAPEIYDCTEDRLIFANKRGMVIYDRSNQKVAAAVDLQEIGCNYFNTDSKFTRILVKNEVVVIFNEQNGKASGEYYEYDLKQEEPKLTAYKKAGGVIPVNGAAAEWAAFAKARYRATFDAMNGEYFINTDTMYSENSYAWEDAQGKQMLSCLLVDPDDRYYLFTMDTETGETKKEFIALELPEEYEAQPKELPAFVYTGDDEMMKVVCEYLCEVERDSYQSGTGEVYIPAPVILAVVEETDVTTVFGNFWSFTYYKNGNMLECVGGGEMPARITLQRTADGYEVTELLKTGDGAGYTEGIKEFCKGYPGVYNLFADYESMQEKLKEIRTELIDMYAENNMPDVKYYKDYGWDPIPLHE